MCPVAVGESVEENMGPSTPPRAEHPGEILPAAFLAPGDAGPPWYDRGMTKSAKITISLPPEQVQQARAAVAAGEASSVSGYISAALAAVAPVASADDEDTLADFVRDLIAEDGEPSTEARAWADRAWAMAEDD